MKYYIKRELNEYGPYTLADLQRYVAQGNILMTDLTRSEGLTDWVPVSQVIGNIPIPVPAAAGAVYGGSAAETVYGGTPGYGVATAPAMSATPAPPDLHWALVLLINFFCGLFGWVWLFVEAGFIRKIKPESKGLVCLILAAVGFVVGEVMLVVSGAQEQRGTVAIPALIGLLILLAAFVLYIVAVFSMRGDLEEYYNTTENIGLTLSGVMTFFFNVLYFQYHFSRIAKWKKTGILEPQR